MSETYFLVSNGARALAVSLAQILTAQQGNVDFDVEDQEVCKVAAMALAGPRFQQNRQPHEDLKVTDVIEMDGNDLASGTEVDEPGDIGLTDNLFVEAAKWKFESDDLGFDFDAEISGLNVQSWRYLYAADALEALTEMPPTRIRRESEPRGQKVQQELDSLKAQVRLLVQQAKVVSCADQTDPAELERLAQQAAIVERMLGEASPKEQIVHATTIQTWEAGEQSAEGFTEDQLKRWNVTLSQFGEQLRLCVWPVGEDVEEAETGLGVLVEISKGYPTLHISPSPNADNSCHVHAISTHEVEVTAGTFHGSDLVPSRVHENESAAVYSNGTPL